MSNPESFIEEVSEELRRDRLFALFRRWGWLGALAVVLLVGAAGYREWSTAQERSRSQAFGDAILHASEIYDIYMRANSLMEINVENENAGAILQFLGASVLGEDDRTDEAIAALQRISDNPQVDDVYRDLALLKKLMLSKDSMSSVQLLDQLEPLTSPGEPFRLLAQEYKAHILLSLVGNAEGEEGQQAIDILKDIVADSDASSLLRSRVQQLLRVFGEDNIPVSG